MREMRCPGAPCLRMIYYLRGMTFAKCRELRVAEAQDIAALRIAIRDVFD